MVEAEKISVLRESFGSGESGKIAYLTILAGTPCEAFIEKAQRNCGTIPDRTVDFDILGNANLATACGVEHEELIKERIRKEAKEKGSAIIPDFSRNGWGKALANS